MHCVFIGCDLVTGKYIPAHNQDPPVRLLLFAIHGFAHAMTSAQELMLSIERAASSSSPEMYHDRRLAKRTLFAAESLSPYSDCLRARVRLTTCRSQLGRLLDVTSPHARTMRGLWLLYGETHTLYQSIIEKATSSPISNDPTNNITIACCITNSIDLASLICLSVTTYYVARRKKFILCSSLNEKYQIMVMGITQIKEALDITRVMLPCGVISLLMKVSSSIAPWIYTLDFQSEYKFTLTGGAYFIIESLNCMICCTFVLRNHAGLRKITERLMRTKIDVVICQEQSAEDIGKLYFESLKSEWN
uniref:G protein-coupled receptor n=1 Tax=Pristionchus pacificus TaxID=54126 RepID=A0A8R1UWD3_PRIPA